MIAADEPTYDETKHQTWASRAIDATGKPCHDVEELAAALGRAWWGYQGWRAGDAEHGTGAKQKALDSLMRQARRFRKTLEEYGAQASPGLEQRQF